MPTLRRVIQDLQRYGYNESRAAEKKSLFAAEFAEKVRGVIPEATDEQISLLQKVFSEGEMRVTTVYDMNPVAPFMTLTPMRRR